MNVPPQTPALEQEGQLPLPSPVPNLHNDVLEEETPHSVPILRPVHQVDREGDVIMMETGDTPYFLFTSASDSHDK